MNNLRRALVLAAIALCGSSASAYHYGMAGCGIGSLAFKDQPGKIQIVAATLNDLISPQTSAISSGTSGCVDHQGGDVAATYIESNNEVIKKEVAQGHGESLNGLLTMWGCSDSATVGSVLQSNYNQIYSTSTPEAAQVSQSMKSVIKSSQATATACKTLI